MSDEPLTLSARFPMPDEVTKNGRVYPPGVLEAAMKKAQAEGTLEVSMGGMSEPALRGKPFELGGVRVVDPGFTMESVALLPDGSLGAKFRVEEQAGAIARLADIVRRPPPPPPPSISSKGAGP
ncbi:MAG TPA: hypothetical protein VFH61_14100 [Thermoleophilia bacterium]|nr:hypothetical protein [Thermoleophilia bacterium]